MIVGAAKFNSLALGELTVKFLGPSVHIEAKAAFVDTRTGQTHGWTKNEQWGPAVVEKLKELRALMELDFGKLHFDNGGDTLVGDVGPVRSAARPEEGGLGEHLTEKVEQV